MHDRECWDVDRHDRDPAYAADLGTRRFFQGSVGTHGMHLLLIADSDNLNLTKPVTEIVATNRIVALPPTLENVGERYGRRFEKPLVAVAAPFGGEPGDGGPDDPEPADTYLAIDAPAEGEYGDLVEVSAVLTTQDGPVAGREVAVGIGTAASMAVTDDQGVATVRLRLEDPAGDHQVRAVFDGDDDHRPAEATQPFTIRHRTTALAYVGDTRLRGNTLEAAARLTERDGAPIAGAEVRFEVDGQPRGTAVTDDDGIARASLRLTGQGRTSTVRAVFAGDERLAASEAVQTVSRGGATTGR